MVSCAALKKIIFKNLDFLNIYIKYSIPQKIRTMDHKDHYSMSDQHIFRKNFAPPSHILMNRDTKLVLMYRNKKY